jgi:hypothetical protein
MPRVVVVLGNTPAECSLEIDGKKIPNAVRIEASVDIDDGPVACYNVPNLLTGGEDTIEIPFDAVIDKRGTPIEIMKDGSIIVKGTK